MRYLKAPSHLRKKKFKKNGKKTESQAKWLDAREAQRRMIRKTSDVAKFIKQNYSGSSSVKSIDLDDVQSQLTTSISSNIMKLETRKYLTLQDFLDDEVFAQLNIAQLFPELHISTDTVGSRLTCPNCGKNVAFVQKGAKRVICHKNVGCGFNRSIVELLALPRKPFGDVYRNVIQKLARNVGKDIPEYLYGEPGAPRKSRVRKLRRELRTESLDQYLSRGGRIKKY